MSWLALWDGVLGDRIVPVEVVLDTAPLRVRFTHRPPRRLLRTGLKLIAEKTLFLKMFLPSEDCSNWATQGPYCLLLHPHNATNATNGTSYGPVAGRADYLVKVLCGNTQSPPTNM